MEQRRQRQPISVYEVILGSWLQASLNGETVPLSSSQNSNRGTLPYYRDAERLIPCKELGYTHIEMLPIAEHPFDGSWGYQVTGYYASTSRYGSPQDLMYFIDQCHQNGIGVIVDWVPGHFPKDGHGLAYFDGSHLYEHADPWANTVGTLVFNYSRHEVRNFLVSNALFGLTSTTLTGYEWMLSPPCYLDYCRKPGEWLPNQYGGRKPEAADFLRQANQVISATSRYSFDSGRVYRLANGVLAYLYGSWALTSGIWVGCTICWITSAWILVPPVPSEQHHV